MHAWGPTLQPEEPSGRQRLQVHARAAPAAAAQRASSGAARVPAGAHFDDRPRHRRAAAAGAQPSLAHGEALLGRQLAAPAQSG